MNFEEQVLKKLDELTREVAQLKAAQAGQSALVASPNVDLPALQESQRELAEQIAYSSESLVKWIKFLDQMMELKEDLVPLGKPMMEELIQSLDQATHGFDSEAMKELIKQVSLNLSNLAQGVAMVGSMVELKNDSEQILKDAFEDTIIRLEELKQKGFFDTIVKFIEALDLVGQKLRDGGSVNGKPIKGVFGLFSALNKKESQEGLGVLVDMLSVLSEIKGNGHSKDAKTLPNA